MVAYPSAQILKCPSKRRSGRRPPFRYVVHQETNDNGRVEVLLTANNSQSSQEL